MRPAALAATLIASACAWCIAPAESLAVDIWSAPFDGVRMLHRRADDVDVRVLLVDLTNPAVSIVATRPADRMITVSEFARRYEADIAINANFFDAGSCGLMVGDFEVMDHAYEDRCNASIGFGLENQVALFDSAQTPRGPVPASWMSNVLSGKPFLMRDGVALEHWTRPQHLYRPNPRSVVGVTADRRALVLVLADGRRRGVPGITAFQLVALLREFDVRDAVNLDGGGSTELVMAGEIVNEPSDGHERNVISHLGIRIRPGVRWDAAEFVAVGSASDSLAGETDSLWLELRNIGRSTWRPGVTSPELVLDDGTVGYLAGVEQETPPGEVGRFDLRWLARGDGERRLTGELRSLAGESLGVGPFAWNVRVHPPATRGAAPESHASGAAMLSAIQLPGGLGAVSVQFATCAVRPGAVHHTAMLCALSILAFIVLRRRRSCGRHSHS